MTRILVVEDSPEQARMIAGLLRGAGFEAEMAADGEEALSMMQAVVPDLVSGVINGGGTIAFKQQVGLAVVV